VKLYKDLKSSIKILGYKAKEEAEKEIKAGNNGKKKFVFEPSHVDQIRKAFFLFFATLLRYYDELEEKSEITLRHTNSEPLRQTQIYENNNQN
jgi:hypothetical protein